MVMGMVLRVSTDTIMACEPPSGYTDQLEDCDDTTGTVSPGILYDGCDGKDNDCDSHIDEDVKAGWQLFTANTDRMWCGTLQCTPVTCPCSQPFKIQTSD